MTTGARVNLDHLLGKRRVLLQCHCQKFLANARALLAAIDDEAPGSDLAVIGNANRERQNRLDFTLARAGLAHLKCGYGTTNCEIIEQFDIFFHYLDAFIVLGRVGRS